MFSVPGWSVSNSDLKPQEAPPSTGPSATTGPTTKQDSDEQGTKSQKRKRKQGKNTNEKVTKANVSDMWATHIEGRSSAQDKQNAGKSGKVEKKKRKLEGKSPVGQDGGKSEISPPVQKKEKPNEGKNKQKKQQQKSQNPVESKSPTNGAQDSLAESLPPPPAPTTAALTPLQQSMRQKLLSARFRHLNETLYTNPSTQALELFSTNPELFAEYHAGFSQQVKESWPSNPVDSYIQAIKTRGATRPRPKQQHKSKAGNRTATTSEPLPRRPNGSCTIADLGCGDAQLAKALNPFLKTSNLKILSFDLHESDPLITKADISSLPVEDGSVDVAIFCLSLMGTNWISFVEEAWRALRSDGKGECWVSEVKSRFGKVSRKNKIVNSQPQPPMSNRKEKLQSKKKRKQPDDEDDDILDDEIYAENRQDSAFGGNDDETDVSAFLDVFRSRGLILKQGSVDKSNKMFVKMEFVKQGHPAKGKWAVETPRTGRFGKKGFAENNTNEQAMTIEEESKVLKPCVYKIR